MEIEKNTKGLSYGAQLGILLGLVGFGLVLSSIVAGFVLSKLTGVSLQQISDLKWDDPHNLPALRIAQIITTLGGFLLPAWVFAKIAYKNASSFIGIKSFYTSKQFLLSLAILISSMFALGALSYINEQIPLPASWRIVFKELDANYDKQIAAFTKMRDIGDLIISLLIMAITPAFVEEILFRGCLQNVFIGLVKKPWIGILLTAILFSAIHFSWSGFLARVFLGLILGLLYYYSKSIWLSITVHALFNGTQIIAVYFDPSFIHKTEGISISIINWIGLGLATILLYMLRNIKRQEIVNT